MTDEDRRKVEEIGRGQGHSVVSAVERIFTQEQQVHALNGAIEEITMARDRVSRSTDIEDIRRRAEQEIRHDEEKGSEA